MNAVEAVAVGAGVLTLGSVLKMHWDLLVSYEYPVSVKGSRWREVRYSARERFDCRRSVLLAVVLPMVVAALAFVLVTGLREVIFG